MKRIICFILSLVMACSLIISTAMAEIKDYPEISVGTEPEVSYTKHSDYSYYKFIPEESGWYCYYSTGDKGICGALADSSLDLYRYSDNYQFYFGQPEYYGDFKIIAEFKAGTTYYLCSKGNYYSNVTYGIGIKKVTAATDIQIGTKDTYSGLIGGTYQLEINYTPVDCIPESIIWSSSDENIVAISSSGEMTYKGVGTATITAKTTNGFSDNIFVEVKDRKEIHLNEDMRFFVGGGEKNWCKFVPAESGKYTIFMRDGVDDSVYTYMTLYDEALNKLESISYESGGVSFTYDMLEGESYYIMVSGNGGCIVSDALVGVVKGEAADIPVITPTPYPTKTPDSPTPTPTVEPTEITDLPSTPIPSPPVESLPPTEKPIETPLPWKNGDVDKDDNVTAGDALEVLKYAAKLLELDNTQTLLADLTEDGTIDATDALEILKSAARINEK